MADANATVTTDPKGNPRTIIGTFLAFPNPEIPSVYIRYLLERVYSEEGRPLIRLLDENYTDYGSFQSKELATASTKMATGRVIPYVVPVAAAAQQEPHEEEQIVSVPGPQPVEKPFWAQDMWVSYFLDSPELMQHAVRTDLGSVHNLDLDFIKAAAEAFAYQGFDPKIILLEMVRNRKRYMTNNDTRITWDLSKPSEDLKVSSASTAGMPYSNHESLARDVSLLNVLFWVRTAKFDKLRNKSKSAVLEIIDMLVDKYEIDTKSRSAGDNLGPRTVTLARICHSLPVVGIRLFDEGIAKFIVKPEDFPGAFPPAKKSLCCPALICVIPKSVVLRDPSILCLCLWVSIRHDDILHRKETSSTPLGDLCRFFLACHNTPSVIEAARITLCSRLGLITPVGTTPGAVQWTLEKDVRTLAVLCRDELPTLRSEDPSHAKLVEFSIAPTIMKLDQFD